jgi:uncharacterized membrane protein YkoI
VAQVRRLFAAGEVQSLEQMVLRARDLRPGTLLDARLVYEAEHAGYVYELLFLDRDGDVWELELDARTGALVDHGRKGD